MFEYSKCNKSIPALLLENISIKVQEDDGLPCNICTACLNKLHSMIEFKSMAIESDIKLRNHMPHNCEVEEESMTCDEEYSVSRDTSSINIDNELQKESILFEPCLEDVKIEICETIVFDESCIKKDHDTHCSDDFNYDESTSKEELKDDIRTSSEDEAFIKSNALVTESQTKQVYLTKKERKSKIIYCRECKRTFGYHYYFKIHLRQHLGDTPFKCEVCGKSFVREFQLNIHKICHSDNRPFSCEECGTHFKTNSALQNHQKVHSDHKPHQCEQCGKSFKNLSNLRAHKVRHENIKQFICELCGKAFFDKTGLKSHKISHTEGTDVPCPECGKIFRNKRSVQVHLRLSHPKKKRHLCDYCGRAFSCKKVMDNHVRIHTGEKPFTCEVCNKSFRQMTTLTLHMHTHSGETPHACKLCPSKYKYWRLLQNHMKVHVEKK
ncbi:hypothetical protein Trydic_g19581 [Trypoxylus dichotomus]